MKRVMFFVLSALLLIGICVSPVDSTEVLKSHVIMINHFDIEDYVEFYKATAWYGEGDTLKIISLGPGGDAYVCAEMITWIKELKSMGVHIVTETGSLAASANFFIWMWGDERRTHEFDMLMSHKAYMMTQWGSKKTNLDENERKRLQVLNYQFRQRLLDVVGDVEVVNDMLDDDQNWYTGEEIFKLGVATELIK